MKRQASKVGFILWAVFALFLLTLQNAQPIMAGKGPLNPDKIDKALLTAIKANPHGRFPVIIQTVAPNDKKALPYLSVNSKTVLAKATAIRAQSAVNLIKKFAGSSAKHINALSIIGGATARLPVEGIGLLSWDPFISSIRLDKQVKPMSNPAVDLSSLYTQIVHAPDVWAQGDTGQGVSVAILDSGIAAVDDLQLPASRIVASVDFVDGTTTPSDPGGHGTHTAGIVAGNGTDSSGARIGVAPGANLVNVRVIGSSGTTNLSTVVRGIQWVVQNRRTYNIRVMNVSLGAPAAGSYRSDPLAGAIEMAWNSGIVVVAAAGNSGPLPGTIVSPGVDPFIITVGALDDNGTLDTADDTLANFSAHGPTLDNQHKPDLVAPGRKIVSLRVPGSYLDLLLPERVTDTNYFRLSGTSMASPVVAGSAALLLQRKPWLQPAQVKHILMHTAHPVGLQPDQDGLGAGLVDAYAATNSSLNGKANRGLTPADDFCKSVFPMLQGMPLTGMWRDPFYKGIDWSNITWDNITWDRTTWDNITWENITWDDITWTNITWDNITWESGVWDSTVNDETDINWDSIADLD